MCCKLASCCKILHSSSTGNANEGDLILGQWRNSFACFFISHPSRCVSMLHVSLSNLLVYVAADVAHVFGSGDVHSIQPANITAHSAADLFWSDGLNAVRHLLRPRESVPPSKAMGKSFALRSLHDIAWCRRCLVLQRLHLAIASTAMATETCLKARDSHHKIRLLH